MAGDPNAGARSAAVQQALSVVDLGLQASSAYKRTDLVDRLRATRRRLADPAFHVFVVGEFKQGKSSLVNALLNAPVCPVDDDIATSAPTAVRYGQEPAAAVLLKPPEPPEGMGRDDGAEPPPPIRQDIPIDQVAGYVTEAANAICAEAIQIHGGVGFTWDNDCHLHYRRAKQDDLLLGYQGWHRKRVADLVLTPG